MKIAKIAGVVLVLLLIVSGSFLWYLTTILHSYPPLTGPYGVGIRYVQVVDQARHEPHSANPDEKRALLLTCYYPSIKLSSLHHTPDKLYLKTIAALKKRKRQHSFLPCFVWDCLLDNMITYAVPNAPISFDKDTYPIILFSHGIGSVNLYTTYLEELTSHGYIVVAVTHPYDTQVTVFPDGRVVELDANFQQMINKNLRPEIYEYRRKEHLVWLEDLNFVVSFLEKLNQDKSSPCYAALDLNRIGVLGHSHGGWVATDFCATNPRCKAGINMDGYTKTAPLKGFNKPFMVLQNDLSKISELDDFYKTMGPQASHTTIAGAGHNAFSDLILCKQPLVRWLGVTNQNQFVVRQAITEHIGDFFDKYLG